MTKEDNIILYHYTTMNTFYNMIEHSLCYEEGDIHPKYITMWATHYAFQNDPTECQLFFEGLKAGILDYTKKNNIALNDKEKDLDTILLEIPTIDFILMLLSSSAFSSCLQLLPASISTPSPEEPIK